MDKIKSWIGSDQGKDILVVAIVILVGIFAFLLGRLSKEASGGLKIEYTGQEVPISAANVLSATQTENGAGGAFFGSSRGTKYYPLGCSAGKNIKIENRIYFKTAQDAEANGYTLSSSCS